MNPYQSTLFFAASYILSALIIIVLAHRRTSLDVRKTISQKTFLKRLLPVIFTVILSISLMTGVYILHMDMMKNLLLIGFLQLLMTLVSNVILGVSWIQRFRIYPRGRELAAILILMYAVSDLFMPSGIKYAVLTAGTALALALPDRWTDWEKK